jgi:hypothetical protein
MSSPEEETSMATIVMGAPTVRRIPEEQLCLKCHHKEEELHL